MADFDTTEPLLLYHDPATGTARAARLSADLQHCEREGLLEEFLFDGRHFVRTGSGVDFWDYLESRSGAILGVVFQHSDIEEPLLRSRLLTRSSNITRNSYGFEIALASTAGEAEIDSARAFGSSLFMNDDDCLVLLSWVDERPYAFPLDDDLTAPVSC
jgi:hypothetical protein